MSMTVKWAKGLALISTTGLWSAMAGCPDGGRTPDEVDYGKLVYQIQSKEMREVQVGKRMKLKEFKVYKEKEQYFDKYDLLTLGKSLTGEGGYGGEQDYGEGQDSCSAELLAGPFEAVDLRIRTRFSKESKDLLAQWYGGPYNDFSSKTRAKILNEISNDPEKLDLFCHTDNHEKLSDRADSREHAALITWTYATRVAYLAQYGGSDWNFRRMVEAYSQPINPAWRNINTPRCQLQLKRHMEKLKLSKTVPEEVKKSSSRLKELAMNTDFACSAKRLKKREYLHKRHWCTLPKTAREAAIDFVEGKLPNYAPGVVDFASATLRKNSEYIQVAGCLHHNSTNLFYLNHRTKVWDGSEVRVIAANGEYSPVTIPERGELFCGTRELRSVFYSSKHKKH